MKEAWDLIFSDYSTIKMRLKKLSQLISPRFFEEEKMIILEAWQSTNECSFQRQIPNKKWKNHSTICGFTRILILWMKSLHKISRNHAYITILTISRFSFLYVLNFIRKVLTIWDVPSVILASFMDFATINYCWIKLKLFGKILDIAD